MKFFEIIVHESMLIIVSGGIVLKVEGRSLGCIESPKMVLRGEAGKIVSRVRVLINLCVI